MSNLSFEQIGLLEARVEFAVVVGTDSRTFGRVAVLWPVAGELQAIVIDDNGDVFQRRVTDLKIIKRSDRYSEWGR